MPHVLVLKNGPRIAAGVMCALMALHPLVWMAADLGRSDLGTVWGSWTSYGTAPVSEGKPQFMVTTLVDLELGLLFTAATGLALARSRFAGAVAGAAAGLTLALRLPLVWTAFTREEPSETTFEYDSPIYAFAVLTTLFQLVLAAAAAATLATGFARRPVQQYDDEGLPVPVGPDPVEPEDVPARPTRTAKAVGAAVLGLVALLAAGGQVHLALTTSFPYASQLLEVPDRAPALQSPYGWPVLVHIALFAVTAFLAATGRPAARGLSVVAGGHMLLGAAVTAAVYSVHGFSAAGQSAVGILSLLLNLVGGVVLLVLMGRPGAPAWADPRAAGAGGPQGPGGRWQPAPGAQQSGGWGVPQQQAHPGGWDAPQAPGYGYPAGPPQQAPQGGWGQQPHTQPQQQPPQQVGWGAPQPPQQQPGYGHPYPGPAPQGQGGPAGYGPPPGPQAGAPQAGAPQVPEPRAGVEHLPTQAAGPAVPPQPARPPQQPPAAQ
ncbi:hypothetical protein [Streptomyces sp. HB2AG]|uniref:hypothetical protein n=1 Tax=Streptomyces sp. HB2AG TaxID=2983400 RepID=UPI0022AA2BF7|nr:hypothetical protein [Streptomyces sp. HB2AG]MCZ2527649.1 hypothetical protein [Streptomyces sp. HB2AG]